MISREMTQQRQADFVRTDLVLNIRHGTTDQIHPDEHHSSHHTSVTTLTVKMMSQSLRASVSK